MASGSGSRRLVPKPLFEKPVIVHPTERHQATIVWLHDRNESPQDAAVFVKGFSLYNVKWICPIVPFICSNTGVSETRENTDDLMEGLYQSADHVAELLKAEHDETVVKGVAGCGMGGAVALHVATCYAFEGRYDPFQLDAVVGISCWLSLGYANNIRVPRSRAERLPVLLTHAEPTYDRIVPYDHGNFAANTLRRVGFLRVKLKTIYQNDHGFVFQTMTEVSLWLTKILRLEGEPTFNI